MYFVKTPAGQQAFKERHADLSPRLRSAFLLFDGNRSLAQVLEAISALGVGKDDILPLVTRGWLATREAGGEELQQPCAAPEDGSEVDPASTSRRYQQAYPMAVAITGGLGLKGFRLNLAVEAAVGYEQLAALAPRIRDAAGERAYGPLHKALFGAEAL
ncbi:hypothetical protein [Comamonas guangdongensis]|uniref:Uncharacterized protein n=1 Tax=Comamonas guangdongensis TaxID=510515 RepID=A0ABV3ZPE2_9BURK